MDEQERLIKRLFLEQACQHCNSAFEAEAVQILAHRRELWLVMVTCLHCQQKSTYVVRSPYQSRGTRRTSGYRISQPLPESSLPAAEEMAARLVDDEPAVSTSPVTADDVLEMHLFLKDFNGDFRQLFNKEK
jgi:hypothetical protein